ncbi:MAG TPA: sensor histidine kinase [Candidatus Dormibacteraeota bacterium]|nr:sensor histidine kinase [Candidatus Dormibacteraeota bacterium]
MATESRSDPTTLHDTIGRLQAAVDALNATADAAAVAACAAREALAITRSDRAAVAFGNQAGEFERVVSASPGGEPLGDDEAAALFSAAGLDRRGRRQTHLPGAMGAELRASGQVIGIMAVARLTAYTELERDALGLFATAVATALDLAGLRQRQREFESALIEMRGRLEQHEAQKNQAAERVRTVERVERAHEQAVEVLTAVSSLAVSGQTLADFYERLGRTVGELVGAGKVLFWRLQDGNMLTPLPRGYGVSASFMSRLGPMRCDPEGDDLGSRVVFKDMLFRANQSDQPSEFAYVLQRLGVTNAMSVPWRAGQERLGLLAAYDAVRPGGFTREDTWVLQKAGLAAALVTRLWHAQEDLRKSVERLTKVDAARQMLLKNMTTVVDKERKRFVAELHDDALQKLTAVEMGLARLVPGAPVDEAALDLLTSLLQQTENALRRLVFEVHPPSLDSPEGLGASIRDRLAMLSASNIEHGLEIDVPEDLPLEMKSLLFRQVSEAIGNVERHSRARRVKVTLSQLDGGIRGVIDDDGQGFVVAERSNLPGHLGLQALKERALMAGGKYNIESKPGSGTRVEFWIPLDS